MNQITFDTGEAAQEAAKFLSERLKENNLELGIVSRPQEWAFTIRVGGEIVAGLCGASNWEWLYIRLFWVKENLRSQGLGAQLLREAQTFAREKSLTGIWIDTFSENAKSLYEREGFVVFGQLPNHPRGVTRYFLSLSIERFG